MFRRGWLSIGVLTAVLPMTLVACGDDDDAGNRIGDAADSAPQTAAAVADAVQSAVSGVTPITIGLDEVNGSGVDGKAIITPEGADHARASFIVNIDDGGNDNPLTAGIWNGACESVTGDPEYNLGEAGDGVSTERFDTGVDDLRQGDFVMALRDGATVVACGEVS